MQIQDAHAYVCVCKCVILRPIDTETLVTPGVLSH